MTTLLAVALLILEADVTPDKTNHRDHDRAANKTQRSKTQQAKQPSPAQARAAKRRAAKEALLKTLHPNAAGIDVGATELWVALPPGAADAPPADQPNGLPAAVRRFGTFTADLRAIADLLQRCGVETVAMEATGVYWIPLFDVLEASGLHVILVDPHQVRRAPGRPKTDVLDCQWIRRLHSVGLLVAAFRPDEPIRIWRAYQRHRATLVADAGRHIQRMQKALEQMNLKLTEVLSDITGQTGLAIIKAILDGQRDPKQLAALRDWRCHESEATIALALEGTWAAEHLFALRQEVELYEFFHRQITACDAAIEAHLATLQTTAEPAPPPKRRPRKAKANEPHYDVRARLFALAGVDLTAIEGIEVNTAAVILSEVGTDMSRWPTVGQFGSWLGLAPCFEKTGGKVVSSRTRPGVNRAGQAFRLAAASLSRSHSALGAFFRRVAGRRGRPKAITATAHKLARLVYALLKHGQAYVARSEEEYEAAHRERSLKRLRRQAAELGLELVERRAEPEPASPSSSG